MALFSQQFGQPDAPPLVLLHGWGMHSGLWWPLVARLESQYAITLIDLPGLGRSAETLPEPYSLPALLDLLADVAPPQATWLGWSLGGIVALAFAQRYPQQVERVITLGSSPCFVQRADWPCAMDAATFAGFEQALEENPAKTLQRFSMLQVQGSDSARADLKALKAALAEIDMPSTAGLLASLALLRADYRDLYAGVTVPTLHILCAQDILAPPAIAERLPELAPGAEVRVLSGQSHVPFLSSPQLVVDYLQGVP